MDMFVNNLNHMAKAFNLLTFVFLGTILVTSCSKQRSGQLQETEQHQGLSEKLQLLRLSEVKPTGWLKLQMDGDLDGFTGHLDSIVPDLILKDDIYGKDRLSKKVKTKDVGAITDDGQWQVQFLWWNSETQSNWWDGYLRNAILTGNAYHLARAEKYVNRILQTQDEDGYLGIYDQELRYKFDNENGELWSKTTLLRGLLGWYEYTKNEKVLAAIEKAAKNIVNNYPINASHPFYSTNPDASGLTHGLMITDIFERLYQLTKKSEYKTYCVFLYKDFSANKLNEDAQLAKLMDSSYQLRGHGAHTYEHLRALSAAAYTSEDPELKSALDKFLEKIASTTAPSGGPIGDEWIGQREADATTTGYEFCSTHELMHSYISLLGKTGAMEYAEKVERVFFNAAQGARHPQYSAIAYLKTDNSFSMNGKRNDDTTQPKQTRYKYSPAHQDAAVCCVPNAGRIGPYYVQSMWMKDSEGLVATLLGPSEVSTEINGENVLIKEITEYPYSNSIRFVVEKNGKKTLTLKIRKPSWADEIKSSMDYKKEGDLLVFRSEKELTDFELTFKTSVKEHLFKKKEVYFTYGSLVYALPIPSKETISKNFPMSGFHDYQYSPLGFARYLLPAASNLVGDDSKITGVFLNERTRKQENRELVPMGKSILRQVTFQRE
jgi:DUF1680 family protein